MLTYFLKCHLKKALSKPHDNIAQNTIISMTTTPKRLHKIWPTVNSILGQSVRPYKIYLWLPRSYVRFQENINMLPKFLTENPYIEVIFVEKDYGPATKLLPALNNVPKGIENIIVIDDDRIYGPEFIKTLSDFAKKMPHHALTFYGSDVNYGKKIKYEKRNSLQKVDILHGYGGYLVKPDFFDKQVFAYPENDMAPFFEDDVWLSCALRQKGVDIYMLANTNVHNWQSLLSENIIGGNQALCRNENKNKTNFFKTWAYFNE